ncbi:aminoglycoside phosphotransferase family protein [Bacillus sp. EAC]|uniref:aminoglycoside phosphotransferase family protein n=1 Tax=Bacillus sp. EAC TaxID=1978338 RepID=UPI000B44F4DE|nr:aminoglycoside phosphotransferase family protein [Bacillus sp. EAC]
MIKQNVKAYILKKYNIKESDFLGKGQEAEVYLYDHDRVIKLYDSTAFKKQQILKRFYESMVSDDINFELPSIHEIIKEQDAILTIEKRIVGRNIQKDLSQYNAEELEAFFKNYLNTIVSIQNINLKTKMSEYKLLSDYEWSERPNDWYDFLKQSLICKNNEVKEYLMKAVLNYEMKYERLLKLLSVEYKGDYSLIHGDFYPSNLLVNEEGKISGVIDFGLMTLYGDFVFDVALSWFLFDLYEELGEKKLENYLKMILDTIGYEYKNRIYLYVLFYSIYSANYFSENCSDGHYQWSVRNLNNEKYWEKLEE